MELQRAKAPDPYDYLPPVPSFTVSSDDFDHGAVLPVHHVHTGSGGGNESPQLSWSGAPEGTRSYAITCYDPDAPTGCGWWHWQVVNLPADVTSVPRNAGAPDSGLLPDSAVQFRNDYGDFGFGGAGPPQGDHPHRYFFVVHALDVDHLDLAPETPNAVVGFHLTAHALARATLLATFSL